MSLTHACTLSGRFLAVQVVHEVGQECLKLQARMRGGLLGTDHSWVADPTGPSQGEQQQQQLALTTGPAHDVQQAAAWMRSLRRLASTAYSAAASTAYNAVEDAQDALAQEVLRVSASGGALLAALAACALLLFWHWCLFWRLG